MDEPMTMLVAPMMASRVTNAFTSFDRDATTIKQAQGELNIKLVTAHEAIYFDFGGNSLVVICSMVSPIYWNERI
jgi:hypothetical protein